MIRPDGSRAAVVDHLPSGQTSLPTGDTIGVADLAFLNGELYALVAGGGCSHGNPDVPAGVIRIDRETGTWRQVADLSQFVMTHPVAHPEPDDFEPDETFYSMIAVRGKLYVVGPNHGQLIEVERNGDVRQVIDISATQGHIVPTSVVSHGGTFQVGNLNTFPIVPGYSQVLDISRGGEILDSIPGFTTIVGLAYNHYTLYALELSAAGGNPAPGAGKVVRLARSGSVEDVVIWADLANRNDFRFGWQPVRIEFRRDPWFGRTDYPNRTSTTRIGRGVAHSFLPGASLRTPGRCRAEVGLDRPPPRALPS